MSYLSVISPACDIHEEIIIFLFHCIYSEQEGDVRE